MANSVATLLLSRALRAISLGFTLATNAIRPTVAASLPHCVGWGVFVPVNAVRLHSVDRRGGDATQDVFSYGYGLKVGGIDAASDTAEMIELEGLWDRPDKALETEPMGHGAGGAVTTKDAVASTIKRPRPQPAAADPGQLNSAQNSASVGTERGLPRSGVRSGAWNQRLFLPKVSDQLRARIQLT